MSNVKNDKNYMSKENKESGGSLKHVDSRSTAKACASPLNQRATSLFYLPESPRRYLAFLPRRRHYVVASSSSSSSSLVSAKRIQCHFSLSSSCVMSTSPLRLDQRRVCSPSLGNVYIRIVVDMLLINDWCSSGAVIRTPWLVNAPSWWRVANDSSAEWL